MEKPRNTKCNIDMLFNQIHSYRKLFRCCEFLIALIKLLNVLCFQRSSFIFILMCQTIVANEHFCTIYLLLILMTSFFHIFCFQGCKPLLRPSSMWDGFHRNKEMFETKIHSFDLIKNQEIFILIFTQTLIFVQKAMNCSNRLDENTFRRSPRFTSLSSSSSFFFIAVQFGRCQRNRLNSTSTFRQAKRK